MRVSVALATYQGERFLPQQLDSIAHQTRLPDEMMVGDDCSSDKTLDLLQSFAAEVPFPVTVETSTERAGSTKNFERIFSMCSGDVIVPSDQDDVWLPKKLERLESAFATSEASLVVSDAYLIDEHGRRRRKSYRQTTGFTKSDQRRFPAGALPMLICRGAISGCMMAIRTDCLPLVLPFPPDPDSAGQRMPHDRWASWVVAALGKLHLLDERLVEYRLHDDQQIGVRRRRGKLGLLPPRFMRWRLATLSREAVVRMMDETLNHLRIIEERVRARLEEPQRSEALERLDYCERHVALRRSLDHSRLRRVLPVAREARSGRYSCSLGLPSVVADLTRR